mmetsp:Transcript_32456/g.74710  ORF Transcript_32456/g.74710 Transcript_32456/m.74710 type:complete len:89 (-) Transcript_32456:538-804(-)
MEENVTQQPVVGQETSTSSLLSDAQPSNLLSETTSGATMNSSAVVSSYAVESLGISTLTLTEERGVIGERPMTLRLEPRAHVSWYVDY